MPRKQISRVPATPRLIREIKPKRQQRNTNQTDQDDSSVHSSGTTSFAASLNVSGEARQRFHKPEQSNLTSADEESKHHTKSNYVQDKWERYKRIPLRKKIQQLLWSMILYYSLRMIYFVDLENASTYANKEYDSPVNVKSVGKTSLLDTYGDLGKRDSGMYDFLGRPVDSGKSSLTSKYDSLDSASLFKSGLSSDTKSDDFLGDSIDADGSGKSSLSDSGAKFDFLGNPISANKAYGSEMSKTYDFFGNRIDSSGGGSQSLGVSSGKLSHTKSFGASDSFGLSSSDSILNSYDSKFDNIQSNSFDNELARPAVTSDTILKTHDNGLDLLGGGFIYESSSNNLLRGGALRMSSFDTDKGLLTMDAANDALFSINNEQSSLSTINCQPHGGPSQSESNEIVYWNDISSDESFTSPFYSSKSQEQAHDGSNAFWKTKYLTFEMDGSGFNNMRLGFENVMLMAHAMGRTLVLPPKRQLAHGLRDLKGRKIVSFSDFYDIATITAKQSGLNVISMEQFLERESLNGNLKGQYPPDNRIKWDNQPLHPLWNYIENVTESFDWHPNECILAFPREGSDGQDLLVLMDDILNGNDGRSYPQPSEYQGKPGRVDAPVMERLREALGGRKKMCIYDKQAHTAHDVVHFKADETDGTRLITQFYAFLWFEDWRQDLWAKRFVRDHLRYRDEIMCLAARVVAALRVHAGEDPTNVNGDYDAIHIRRTDFQSQFPDTELSSSELLMQLQKTVKGGSTLFIATDEHNQTFFKDIEAMYDVKYLGDFSSEISSINPNFFGLVEQIVASRSRNFIGTYYSSFSAFIVRLRGYYSVREKREGYTSGALRDTFYLPEKYRNAMRMYQSIQPPFYARDFPSAWRDIDHLDLPRKVEV